jgi:hypothetical protein
MWDYLTTRWSLMDDWLLLAQLLAPGPELAALQRGCAEAARMRPHAESVICFLR